MHPELFRFFGVGFPAYFVLLVSGFMFATALGVLWARRIGENPDVIVDLGISMLIAGVAGGRILHVFADGYFWDYVHLCTDPAKVDWHVSKGECLATNIGGVWDATTQICHPGATDCFAWAKFWAGGLTYYGGFIGAVVAAYFLLKRDRFPFWRAADMAGFAVPMGLAFGRMGCLLAGCCFGAPTALPWGLAFPPNSPASDEQFRALQIPNAHVWSLAVHPTQIYESAASLAIAAICYFIVHPRKKYDGQVFVIFTVLYAVARIALEVLRRDDRGGIGFLSTSQWLGIGLIVGAAVIHHFRSRPLPPAAPPAVS
ncbi:MAG: prolipoprotein diacylglyceryl transferase family protein [Polyangiaceae bacterium]